MTLHVNVLGPLELSVEGEAVDPGSPKARALLVALVLHRGRVASVETLVEMLWGDDPPTTAHKSIHKYVSLLRRPLGDAIVTRTGGYMVDREKVVVDVDRFEEALSGDPDIETIRETLALWRGDPYPELADTDAGVAEAGRLGEIRLRAIEALLARQIEAGRAAEVVGDLETLVTTHPYRERLWALLMRALYRSGRQSEALGAFARLRRVLGEELGIDPSPELRTLEEQILLHDPALAPPAPAVHNLPATITSFIGRDTEMEELGRLLATTRLVTLLGPAGSGKTRLAIETGRSHLGRFPDGVWFIDLAPALSPDQVLESIAKPLGVGRFGEAELGGLLFGYLAERGPLLIVDNCEHLVAKVAETVRTLLERCPRLVVLATSRERLGVTGETIFDVMPLPYPGVDDPVSEVYDAVRLFMDRVRSVTGAGEGTPEVVGEIVRRLDGIPLALELAAARVRGLGLIELRDHLDDRFSILSSPTGVDRHQTLQAAVDWSYRLLGVPEQVLFRRLSVFRGGFDLDAVVAVCGFEPVEPRTVPTLLSDLVDKSLVTAVGGASRVRYNLLETLREYAAQAADPSESTRLRDAHAGHFLEIAENAQRFLRGPEQREWLALLRTDHDNLLKALRWVATTSPELLARFTIALSPFWDQVGPRAEGHEWTMRAIEVSAGLDPRLRVDLQIEASNLASSKNAAVPRGYALGAVDEARAIGYRLGEARALLALAWAYAIDARTEEANAIGVEAFELLGDDDPWEQGLWYERMGQASFKDPERSLEMLGRALDIYRTVGDRSREALVLYKVAEQLAGSGRDLEGALAHARSAIEVCEEVGNIHDGAHARLEYGKVLRRAGRFAEAMATLEEALAELTKQGDERCTLRSLTAMGITHLDAGDPAAARELLTISLQQGRALEEQRTTRTALAGMARIAADTSDTAQAVTLFGFVDELGSRLDIPASEVSQSKRESRLATLVEGLGHAEFDRLWEMGQKMTIEEAVELALAPSPTVL